VRHFQNLIVSAVKICKQCLQTASASRPLPLDLTAGLPHVESLDYRAPMKLPGAATARIFCRKLTK